MQAFWGTCFVTLAEGQFGRIIRDSIRVTGALHLSCTKLRCYGSSDMKVMCFLIFPIIPVYFRSMNPLLRIFQS